VSTSTAALPAISTQNFLEHTDTHGLSLRLFRNKEDMDEGKNGRKHRIRRRTTQKEKEVRKKEIVLKDCFEGSVNIYLRQ
jgi:hypothetical protein